MDDPPPETRFENPERDRIFDVTHLRQDLGRRTVQGAAMSTGLYGVGFLLETVRIIVLARLLLPADYGLVAMVTVATGLIDMFRDLGLNMATVTREKITHAQVSTLFWVNVSVGLALAVLTAAIAPLLAWFYGEARLVSITLVLAPTFMIAGLTVQHQAILRRQMRFGVLSGIRVLSISTGLAAGVLLAYRGAGYWALIAIAVAAATTNAIAVWVASGWRPGRPRRGVGAGEMIRFGAHVTGANLTGYLSRRLDHVLLGWWWGATSLGLYTKANSLMQAPTVQALRPVGSVAVTSLSRLTREPERYRDAYLRMLEKTALVLMPGAVFMFAAAPWLIPFLLGPRWAEAAPIFAIMAILAFMRPVDGTNWWLFVTQNRADEAFRLNLIGGAITAVAVVIGLPWGGVGVATGLAASSGVRVPLIVWYVTRRGPVRASDIYRTLATPALASLSALAILIALAQHAAGLAPALVLTVGLVVTLVVVLMILCAIPAGRRALLDTWALLQLLRGRGRPGGGADRAS